MKRKDYPCSHCSQHGMALLETLVAFLILSVGILGLVGLQGSMVQGTTNAKYRSDANYIAQQRLGRMWADPCNLATYSTGDGVEDISSLLPNGTVTVVHQYSGNPPKDTCSPVQLIDQTSVTVSWQPPGDPDVHSVVNSASITGG